MMNVVQSPHQDVKAEGRKVGPSLNAQSASDMAISRQPRVLRGDKGDFYEQVTEVKVCFYFFLHWVFAFVVVFGCDACCSPPGFYSHSR
jgi:hypothetical protein